jgi:hypothetical protein
VEILVLETKAGILPLKVLAAELLMMITLAVAAVLVLQVERGLLRHWPELVELVQLLLFLAVLQHTLEAVAVAVVEVIHQTQVAPVAVVEAGIPLTWLLLALPIVALVVAVVVATPTKMAVLVVLVLLLFVTQIPTLLPPLQQALLQLQQRADSEFIAGLVQVQLLSKVTHGTFCTT